MNFVTQFHLQVILTCNQIAVVGALGTASASYLSYLCLCPPQLLLLEKSSNI